MARSHYHHGRGGDPLAIILALPIALLIGGIFLALEYIQFEPCGQRFIEANDQVYCVIKADTAANALNVHFDSNVTVKGVTTYVFTKQPKTYTYDRIMPVQTFDKVFFYTFACSAVPDSKVKYYISVDAPVDIEYMGDVDDYTPEEKVYSKASVTEEEDAFIVKGNYASQRFSISSSHRFTGFISVNITSPRFDLDSVKYEKKCSTYPCEWDFSEEEKLKGKELYLISENTGDLSYNIYEGEKTPHVGYLVGGIIMSIVGLVLVVIMIIAIISCIVDCC